MVLRATSHRDPNWICLPPIHGALAAAHWLWRRFFRDVDTEAGTKGGLPVDEDSADDKAGSTGSETGKLDGTDPAQESPNPAPASGR